MLPCLMLRKDFRKTVIIGVFKNKKAELMLGFLVSYKDLLCRLRVFLNFFSRNWAIK